MPDLPPTGPTDDEARLGDISSALAAALAAAVEPWARAQLRVRLDLVGEAGAAGDPAVTAAVDAAVAAYGAAVIPRIDALLATDIDAQRTTPLSVLRDHAALLHPPLEAAGVPEAVRDDLDRARDPEDRWALAPATWADLGPAVAEAGITWGAAKAHVHLARRRARGG